jgi:molybdopterin synthase sulfur carrier subunit
MPQRPNHPTELMSLPITIPTQLRPLTDNLDIVEVDGETIGDLLKNLGKRYPALNERIFDAQGNVRRFLNVYVNQDDIRWLQEQETPVKSGDEISIVPGMQGG